MFELPDRFKPDFINGLKWVETQYSNLLVCEYGMLRRPVGASSPGTLVYATPNKDYPPRYRIMKLGGTKQKYTVNVEDLMIECFGKRRNPYLMSYDYLRKIKVLCLEYNRRYHTRDDTAESKLMDGGPGKLVKRRLCAGVNGKSCGKMTYNYRCDACWIAIRGGLTDLSEDISYSIAR